jgi:transcriptional regulator with XRE-family HTH domain
MRKALRIGGISVSAMAEELGVERNTVGRYINGHTRPSRPTIIVWAMRCGVPTSWLETGILPTGGADPETTTHEYSPVFDLGLHVQRTPIREGLRSPAGSLPQAA